jgi:glutaredoxin
MENIENPASEGYTIYSKSGCINCTKIKNLLKDKHLFFSEIQCDEYLLEDKEGFLMFIKERAKKEHKTFPIIFYNSGFIGGYNEAKENIEKREKRELDFEDI